MQLLKTFKVEVNEIESPRKQFLEQCDIYIILKLQVHGGTSYEEIERKVGEAEAIAERNEKHGVDTVLFFDEANTTAALDMIKEVMVDRRLKGRPVGKGLKRLQFIAACNPYRRSGYPLYLEPSLIFNSLYTDL